MSKTYRRNDGRRPKWDKSGSKSRKYREIEDEFSKRPKRKDWGFDVPKKRGPDVLDESDISDVTF